MAQLAMYATQVWGPELDPQHPWKHIIGIVACTYNPSTGNSKDYKNYKVGEFPISQEAEI